ncbi:MAG: MBL fold metallo-hydrolase [Bacillota bacterium]|nr:MBL fold metallo-hydrolase [Bacillota bacterium]
MLRITVLVENTVRRRDLLAEHGLSLWLECDDAQILFDAGQSDAYLRNARHLGIDFSTTDRIVLSHGHYDHGNGFRHYPVDESGVWPRFFAHPDAFARRYAVHDDRDSPRSVGLNWIPADLPSLEKHLMLNTGTVAIAADTCLCSHIPDQVSGAEPAAGFLIEKEGNKQPDRFLDEQILISRQKNGLVVICGCCHPGLLNSLKCVHRLYPGEHIHAVLGGFHLNQYIEKELDDLVSSLKALSFDMLVPMHCSGHMAWCRLREAFPDRCLSLQTGDVIEF